MYIPQLLDNSKTTRINVCSDDFDEYKMVSRACSQDLLFTPLNMSYCCYELELRADSRIVSCLGLFSGSLITQRFAKLSLFWEMLQIVLSSFGPQPLCFILPEIIFLLISKKVAIYMKLVSSACAGALVF